jgi:hypothetical protein
LGMARHGSGYVGVRVAEVKTACDASECAIGAVAGDPGSVHACFFLLGASDATRRPKAACHELLKVRLDGLYAALTLFTTGHRAVATVDLVEQVPQRVAAALNLSQLLDEELADLYSHVTILSLSAALLRRGLLLRSPSGFLPGGRKPWT